MGILSNIFHKIFPASHPAVAPAPQDTAIASPAQQSPAAPITHLNEVDIEAILNDKAQQASQPLNWRSSIVDLLKLLDLDSSLQARKQLAQELHYSGDTENSASMNVWLHRQVMNKLAQNGGNVPADLKD
jgi:hypothetical protein